MCESAPHQPAGTRSYCGEHRHERDRNELEPVLDAGFERRVAGIDQHADAEDSGARNQHEGHRPPSAEVNAYNETCGEDHCSPHLERIVDRARPVVDTDVGGRRSDVVERREARPS